VVATGMTITPAAGTYLAFFTGAIYETVNGTGPVVTMSIYAGGAQIASSPVSAADTASFDTPFCCVAVCVVNGAQAIEGRWSQDGGGTNTATMHGNRSLKIMKIA
jgi:hypothetical protein